MINHAHEDDSNRRIAEETGTPRWVKVFGIITLLVVLAFIVLMFTRGPGGRGHTPSRHFGGQAP